ncbi:MAG: hypothetical protein IKT40_03735 [Bacilli bacterium]|nr:hypothetical protein [Bacilli bacterium]
MIDKESKANLMNYIKENIEKNFSDKYITHNLINTIKIIPTETGFKLEIPAKMYDFKEWNKNKVIVPYGNGSYAQRVNKTGGFSGEHKNYIEKAINEAIHRWLKENNYKLKGAKKRS